MKKLLLTLALGLLLGCQDEPFVSSDFDVPVLGKNSAKSATGITVMTRNLYIGADVDQVLEASDPGDIPALVAQAWATLQATDFAGRMRAIAQEISEADPDLIGLQEVYILSTETPGDDPPGAPDASVIRYHFLDTLLAELGALGADYYVAAIVQNSDIEMPGLDFTSPNYLTDVRVTDFDVVLARWDVATSNVIASNYGVSYDVYGNPIKRGYIVLDADVRGQSYRLVNTHPEPAPIAGGAVQLGQISELLAILDAMEAKPTILLGDLNTPAPGSPGYQMFTNAGFEDVWVALGKKKENGLTCCHLPTLDNPTQDFYERIDLIFVKHVDALTNGANKLQGKVEIVGKYDGMTALGVWPSDHAGLVADLHFPRPGK